MPSMTLMILFLRQSSLQYASASAQWVILNGVGWTAFGFTTAGFDAGGFEVGFEKILKIDGLEAGCCGFCTGAGSGSACLAAAAAGTGAVLRSKGRFCKFRQ